MGNLKMKASKDKFQILTGLFKKKIMFGILCVLLVTTICISGCISTGEASTTEIPTLTGDGTAYDPNVISVYVDPQTGVNYLIYSVQLLPGGLGGMCPRYDADGTLYVSEITS